MLMPHAVSNTATIGVFDMTARQALMPMRFAGLCSGASGVHSSIMAMTSSSISTDLVNFVPPWTTR